MRSAGGKGASAREPVQDRPGNANVSAGGYFADCGAVRGYGRGETIFNEGDEVRCAYRLLKGAVQLSKVTADGRRQILEYLLPGDTFGFESSREFGVTAEALADCELEVHLRRPLPAPGSRLGNELLIEELRRKLATSQAHLLLLGRRTARERVAHFLLNLQDRAGQDGTKLYIPFRRREIADYLGMTLETVSRILSDMKRCGIIDIPGRQAITIRKPEALKQMATCDKLVA